MGLDYQGGKSVGACIPVALTLEGQLEGSIGGQFPALQAQLSGIIAAQIGILPPSIVLAVTPPAINFQLMASVQASILVSLGSLTAQIAAAIALRALLLGNAGIHFYTYSGVASALGPSIPPALPGGASTDQVYGVLLLTSMPSLVTALNTAFGVSIST
jgi:hypothetical protein